MAEAVAGIALEKATDSLFGLAKKKIGYMWNCKENVKKFRDEVESLKVMQSQVQQQIVIAKDKGDNLIVGVEEWLNKAGEEISKAEVFLGKFLDAKKTCFKIGMCGNWATLYHYGKGATEMMTPLNEHKESGTNFVTRVSVETPPPTQLDVYQTKNPEDLVTHNSALNDIISALEDESKQIIGIYGLGGVGKTTLAMEAAARVKKTNRFADVAVTTISQTVNANTIKKDLEKARKRVMKGDKILIILDDVWEKLNLEELCIPIDHTNCRILLTSRNEDVCEKMNSQSNIYVDSLPTEEAWILFKRVVGERVETDTKLKPVAMKVVKECGGLPLLIQAVGNALKNKSISSWDSALSRLKKAVAPSEIDPDIRKAYTRLQLSYDYLESEEAKSCFLLCSMFPEDWNILLEDLVYYCVGLQKFDDLDSIEDARGRVQNAVNTLTSSGLLLKSYTNARTIMHDVVRDVARLIASQGENKFLVKAQQPLREWLPSKNDVESYKVISLMENDINKLPDYEVDLENLQLFILTDNHDLSMINDEFIRCMINVKVLDISRNNLLSLPSSFQRLKKLRTLDLRGNKSLHEISILGEVKDLEILILNETGITEIPEEIGQLVKLRVFQVKDCTDLARIAKGVISALSRMEELSIDLRRMSEGVKDCTAEVMKLLKLTYLDIKVKSLDLIIEGFNLENLKGFVIQTGNSNPDIEIKRSDCCLIISEHLLIPFMKWLKKLIEGSHPNTILSEIENLNNMMPTLYDEGFSNLEHIELHDCPNMSCLVDDDTAKIKTHEKFFKELKNLRLKGLNKLEMLWKCPDEYICLTNLVSLCIEGCDKLERVFTVNVAQCLVHLKILFIDGCEGLKEIIWGGGGGDDGFGNIIVFPSLAEIYLFNLRKLASFYSGGSVNCSIKYPSLVAIQSNCESMKIWGPGIHEIPKLDIDINDAVAKMHESLTEKGFEQQNEPEENDK
uniref:probable disease resistance protein At4g27220 n=1 Tax=Erigeron canadensis TaxID=72917 RepID=UPI001CB8BC8D|nr:probable disease resistance protein At4g27220 [Erigeron canadensis]